MAKRYLSNWEGSRVISPTRILQPVDAEEVARIVRGALEQGRKVKAVGSLLSWSDIHDAPGDLLLMTKMNRVLEIDKDRRLVRVQGGARLDKVNTILRRNGLAFENFGSITSQTVAGYIGTASHGTCAPILSSRVEEMTLVDGMGNIRRLSRSSEPEVFRCARVHLGCLGIVTEVVLSCVEAFWLEERLELMDFDRALSEMEKLIEQNDYVKFWWLPYQRKVQVYRYNRTKDRKRKMGFTGLVDQSGLSGLLFSALIETSRAFPIIVRPLLTLVQLGYFRSRVRANVSDRIIPYAGAIPKHQETEYAVPRLDAPKVVEEIRRLVCRPSCPYRVNFPLEVRFVPADDIPLSPSYRRDSVFVGPYVANRQWAEKYFCEAEEVFWEYKGRPHWGKHFRLTAKEFAQVYPEWEEFCRIRRLLDPRGVFSNSFTARVFGL